MYQNMKSNMPALREVGLFRVNQQDHGLIKGKLCIIFINRGGESYLKVRGQTNSWMDYTINQLIKNMQ